MPAGLVWNSMSYTQPCPPLRWAMRVVLVPLVGLAAMACTSEVRSPSSSTLELGDCSVQLFDGDNFKDDNTIVQGPGEFPDLSKLPGATKNWDDEADSFKVAEGTVLTVWTIKNFEGDSVIYSGPMDVPSADEPRSMKIRCKR